LQTLKAFGVGFVNWDACGGPFVRDGELTIRLRDEQPTSATAPALGFDDAHLRAIATVVAETLRQLGLAGGAVGSGNTRPTTTAPAFLSMREIAARLGISEATAWRWHAAGSIGAAGARGGGRRLFNRAEIDAWIENGTRPREEWAPIWIAKKQREATET